MRASLVTAGMVLLVFLLSHPSDGSRTLRGSLEDRYPEPLHPVGARHFVCQGSGCRILMQEDTGAGYTYAGRYTEEHGYGDGDSGFDPNYCVYGHGYGYDASSPAGYYPGKPNCGYYPDEPFPTGYGGYPGGSGSDSPPDDNGEESPEFPGSTSPPMPESPFASRETSPSLSPPGSKTSPCPPGETSTSPPDDGSIIEKVDGRRLLKAYQLQGAVDPQTSTHDEPSHINLPSQQASVSNSIRRQRKLQQQRSHDNEGRSVQDAMTNPLELMSADTDFDADHYGHPFSGPADE